MELSGGPTQTGRCGQARVKQCHLLVSVSGEVAASPSCGESPESQLYQSQTDVFSLAEALHYQQVDGRQEANRNPVC